MTRLKELLRQARKVDPQLGADLEAEIVELRKQRTFGLVFEPHQPEAVELPGRPPRRGDKVRVLPPRGDLGAKDQYLWEVTRIERTPDGRVAHIQAADGDELASPPVPVEDIVVVAEYRDVIYPGLVETGRINRGGDKPAHTIINAENAHALEMLTYTHRHSVDAIYIDPPYNTGAKDWTYNNNYVAKDDDYRHSKWLAFMERRLKLSRELLSPSGSLVVTIDEHEVHRLGVLLDQVFPDYHRQMVTIVNNPKGVTQGYLSRVEEYAFFVFGPESRIASVDDDLLTHRDVVETADGLQRPRWKGLLRSGDDALRADRKDMFYPVWLHADTLKLSHAGEALPLGQEPDFSERDGLVPAWPIRRDGKQGRWGVGPATLNSLIEQGFASCGRFDKKRATWAITYLSQQVRADLDAGLLTVLSMDDTVGVADVAYVDAAARRVRTVWHRSSHDAGAHGTDLVGAFLGSGRSFPFPKSLYAVEDALRPLIGSKPNAVVLDFFAGSGTTAHAVMRLNRQDGGRRQSISVTNNEVSAEDQADLRSRGLRPADPEWEAQGICDFITKPRVSAAISGVTPQGAAVRGQYRFTDEFPFAEGFEENATFFTLTYEAPLTVRHNRAFARIAPILWLRAGSVGTLVVDLGNAGWATTERYGVLANLDESENFLDNLISAEGTQWAFIVTDDDSAFQMVCQELPHRITPVQLYESYLQNFEINTGRFA